MSRSFKPRFVFLSVIILQTIFPYSPLWADQDPNSDKVFAVAEKVEGKTRTEWNVLWCRWAFGIKRDRNPITDKTGQFAAEGQTGPVWFLGGNLGGTTVRKLDIPAGKPIFLPVVYQFLFGDQSSERQLQFDAKTLIDEAKDSTDMEILLDGQPINNLKDYRVATGAFLLKFPDLLDAVLPVLSGTKKFASDGYWVMLKPLSKGEHTLRVKARVRKKDDSQYNEDITYHITIIEN
jgi:hypothetical protein